jgi:hypothetical protein
MQTLAANAGGVQVQIDGASESLRRKTEARLLELLEAQNHQLRELEHLESQNSYLQARGRARPGQRVWVPWLGWGGVGWGGGWGSRPRAEATAGEPAPGAVSIGLKISESHRRCRRRPAPAAAAVHAGAADALHEQSEVRMNRPLSHI